ncbi:MAG TPA: tetratricopeptide repeat protein [Bryobacteraceae bacterium]|nr:tetratricopeptide repeat protein [Bryobacteraceae bacterium]
MRWRTGFLILLLLVGATSCSRDPEVVKRKYVENGNRYFDRGKYKEASIMYRSALKKDLRYGEAYYRLGLVQLKLNQPMAAVASLRRAVELQPDNEDAKTRLADLYLAAYLVGQRGRDQLKTEVKDLAGQLLRKTPNSFDGNRLLGHVEWRDGNLKGAIERFRKADLAKPNSPNLVLALSQVLAADSQFDEAEKLAKSLIEKDPSFGAIYDSLYVQYARQNRLADAENLLKLRVEKNPNNSQYMIRLAGHYYVLGRRDDASNVFQRMIDNPREFPNARQEVGDFYLRFREFAKAVEQYEAGVKNAAKKEDQLVLKRRVADALIAWGKRPEASNVIEEVLKENPKDEAAKAMRASLMLDTGSREQLQGVLNDLQAAVTRMPNNPVVRYNLGRAHWAKGELDHARTQFREAVNLRPDYMAPRLALTQLHVNRQEWALALQTANETLAISPANLTARLLRAVALRGTGNPEQARKELVEIAQRDPSARDAYFQLGRMDLSARNFKQAEENFQKCGQNAGNDLRCMVGLVETYAAQNQYDKAIQLLQETGRKMPDRSEITVTLANTYVRAAKYDQAATIFQELISKDPKSSDYHIKLGETYRRMGKQDAAIQYYRKAKDLSPNDPMAYAPLAVMLDVVGRKAEAADLYRQLLKLQPDNPLALNNLAYVLAETGGNLDEALTLAQRARQKLPQDLNVADTLGWIYIKKNLAGNAIDIYKELTAKNPDNPTFRFHMAMALVQKGDRPQARRELQTALQNKPSKEEEGKIRELIAKIG